MGAPKDKYNLHNRMEIAQCCNGDGLIIHGASRWGFGQTRSGNYWAYDDRPEPDRHFWRIAPEDAQHATEIADRIFALQVRPDGGIQIEAENLIWQFDATIREFMDLLPG